MNLRSFILGTVATNLALVGALLWQKIGRAHV